jgi:glutamine amidotransferase
VITVLDYGAGNLASVRNALQYVGMPVTVTADPSQIRQAQALIFPGVGAAREAMAFLKPRGLDQAVLEFVRSGRPYLGICLGLQMLFEYSEEEDQECLGALPGVVRRFQPPLKLPHMGWNAVDLRAPVEAFEGIPSPTPFYFVHSYYPVPRDDRLVTGWTDYGERFASVVVQDQVLGVQFHPERSGTAGLRLLENFAARLRQAVAS